MYSLLCDASEKYFFVKNSRKKLINESIFIANNGKVSTIFYFKKMNQLFNVYKTTLLFLLKNLNLMNLKFFY